jgi:hypothetical protein
MASARIRSLIGVALVLTIGAAVGCTQQQKALQINNSVSSYTKALEEAGKKFGEAVKTVLQGGPKVDVAPVRAAFTNLQGILAEARSKTDGLKTEGVAGAEPFKVAASKFFRSQEELVNEEFKKVVETLENKTLNNSQKQNLIVASLQAAASKEQGQLAEVRAAQTAFAGQHNIILK